MRRAYVVGHWVFTLLLAPFTSEGLHYVFLPNPHQIAGLLEVYPISLVFSIAFSLPTFLLYLLCFYFLAKHDVSPTISKFILIAVSVLGIYITQTIIKGSMSRDIILAYTVTAIFVGLLLRLQASKIERGDNTVTK